MISQYLIDAYEKAGPAPLIPTSAFDNLDLLPTEDLVGEIRFLQRLLQIAVDELALRTAQAGI